MSTPSLRQRHADLTRRAILDAARQLFSEHGYANTPIRRIAEAAGVAVQTIYSTFGSKPGVLVGMLDLVDQQTVEPIVTQLMTSSDPGEMVTLMARLERSVREAGGDVLRLVARAAASDAEVAQVWDQGFDRHRMGVTAVCRRLADGGYLRPGLTAEDATATALALTSVEAYDELVQRQGWSHDRYQEWLSAALGHALLGQGETV